MRRETLDALRAARRDRIGARLATDLSTGAQTLDADSSGTTGLSQSPSGELFLHVFQPTPRLIIVGAVHIAQKLAPLARLSEFAVTIVDPRGAFATAARFPDIAVRSEWPDRALESLRLDRSTAIVTLSHDPKIDDPGLIAALRSPAFYIGALGSRKTHARRIERLTAEGFDADDIARIRAPVGLPIGAVSPGEIAVSIMAEIVACRHGRFLQLAAS
jgi:xanthine dehydrogenase accessory factor